MSKKSRRVRPLKQAESTQAQDEHHHLERRSALRTHPCTQKAWSELQQSRNDKDKGVFKELAFEFRMQFHFQAAESFLYASAQTMEELLNGDLQDIYDSAYRTCLQFFSRLMQQAQWLHEPPVTWPVYQATESYRSEISMRLESFWSLGSLLGLLAIGQSTMFATSLRQPLGHHLQPFHRSEHECEHSLFNTPEIIDFLSRLVRSWIHFLRFVPIEVLRTFEIQPQFIQVAHEEYGLLPLQFPLLLKRYQPARIQSSKEVLGYCKTVDRLGRTLFVPLVYDFVTTDDHFAVYTSLFAVDGVVRQMLVRIDNEKVDPLAPIVNRIEVITDAALVVRRHKNPCGCGWTECFGLTGLSSGSNNSCRSNFLRSEYSFLDLNPKATQSCQEKLEATLKGMPDAQICIPYVEQPAFNIAESLRQVLGEEAYPDPSGSGPVQKVVLAPRMGSMQDDEVQRLLLDLVILDELLMLTADCDASSTVSDTLDASMSRADLVAAAFHRRDDLAHALTIRYLDKYSSVACCESKPPPTVEEFREAVCHDVCQSRLEATVPSFRYAECGKYHMFHKHVRTSARAMAHDLHGHVKIRGSHVVLHAPGIESLTLVLPHGRHVSSSPGQVLKVIRNIRAWQKRPEVAGLLSSSAAPKALLKEGLSKKA